MSKSAAVFNKKKFINDVTETVRHMYRKQLKEASQQEIFQAVSYVVKDVVIDACLNATVCKNLFLCNRQKTNFYLLMMPGDKPFKTKELSHQLGIARLSFASPEDMEQYLDCTPGSSSIMGLVNDAENKVQLLMDEDIKAGEYLGCHPCINTSSLKLRTADVLETFLPAVHHEPIFVHLTGE